MKRVYHKDDYKSMAVDLLCVTSQLKVLESIFSFGGALDVHVLVHAAAILTKIGNTIDSEPMVVDDSNIVESVYSKT